MFDSRPAFLVDGHMEKLAMQKICPGRPVRILACNGKDVSAVTLAKRAATHIRLLTNHCYPFVIITDREQRSVSASRFAGDVDKALRGFGIKDKIIIGVADRMIENWIYCERDIFGENARCSDGEHGTHLINKALGRYNKTAMGPAMLYQCRPSQLIASPSFESFFKQLAGVSCEWLGR